MALWSYSGLDILLPRIIFILQDCSQVLNTCKCLYSLSGGSVSNVLLVPSITFHCHYYIRGCMCSNLPYIWGCMCSTGPFQLSDWKDISVAHVIIIIKSEPSTLPIVIIFSVVVRLRCVLHHILSLGVYIFRKIWDFVFIIIERFMNYYPFFRVRS